MGESLSNLCRWLAPRLAWASISLTASPSSTTRSFWKPAALRSPSASPWCQGAAWVSSCCTRQLFNCPGALSQVVDQMEIKLFAGKNMIQGYN